MRDDPLKNLAIVNAVKDIPQLYLRESTISKAELERLWNVVGDKLDMPGIAARDRWRVIRGSYVRYMRTPNQKKEYYLKKYLEFLKPYVKFRDSTSGGGNASSTIDEDAEASDVEGSDGEVVVVVPSPKPAKRGRKSKTEAESPKKKVRRVENTKIRSEEEEEIFLNKIGEGDDEEDDDEVPIVEFHHPTEGNSVTMTLLHNGQLVDQRTGRTTTVATVEDAATDEEKNSDLMFLKSLLEDMSRLTHKQKTKFKIAVMTKLSELMD